MTRQTRAESALFMTTIIWGSTFAFMKIALQDVSPILMGAVRFGAASAFLLLVSWRVMFPFPLGAVKSGFILGYVLFLGFVSQNIGLLYTTASKSAFITSLMVVFVPFFQIFVERRPPTWGNIMGIGVVLVGLWFLTSPSGSEFNIGDVLTLGTAVSFALYIVYLDIASKTMSAVQLTFLQSVSSALFSAIAAIAFEEMLFRPTSSLLASLAYLTLFATIITTYIQTSYQKFTTPTRAAIIFTIEPVWASLFAYAILGEQLGAAGMAGGALILIGILTSELSDKIPVLKNPMSRLKRM